MIGKFIFILFLLQIYRLWCVCYRKNMLNHCTKMLKVCIFNKDLTFYATMFTFCGLGFKFHWLELKSHWLELSFHRQEYKKLQRYCGASFWQDENRQRNCNRYMLVGGWFGFLACFLTGAVYVKWNYLLILFHQVKWSLCKRYHCMWRAAGCKGDI